MNPKKICYVAVCVVMLILFFVLMLWGVSKITLSTSCESLQIEPVVVIDAGHGGEDGGAVSSDGVLEKDINLVISDDTADLLIFFGFDVIRTRSTDTSLSNGESTVRARKVSDMKKRLEIFNSSKNNVVISIHQNKFTQSQYYGTQVFYSPNNENSVFLAESIRNSVVSLIQPDNTRECKAADSGIYLLKNSINPAVIVECGFISNPEECEKLTDTDYQKQIAYCIAMGFLEYQNKI